MLRWPLLLLLCLLTLGHLALCQDVEQPSAALDAAVAAELLPEYAVPAAHEAAALIPLSEVAKAQLVDGIVAGITATKDEVKQALANPSAAFQQYTAQWATGEIAMASVAAPGSVRDTKTLAQRKRIFMANLRKYDMMNAQDPDAAHGITPFSHLTQAEFQAIMLPLDLSKQPSGPIPSPSGSGGRKLKACGDAVSNPYASGTPPKGVNWVTANKLSPIRNQGGCGSCAAFATVGVAEHAYIVKNNISAAQLSSVNLSEQDLMNCMLGDQCQGAYLNTYIPGIINCASGMANEVDDPYIQTDPNVCKSIPHSSVGIANWAWVQSKSVTALALAVAKAPTAISLNANKFSGYKSGVLGTDCKSDSSINHAVVAVGYIAGMALPSGSKVDVWIVRNSWGTSWGGNNPDPYKGYVYIRKDCTKAGALNMYLYNPWVPILG